MQYSAARTHLSSACIIGVVIIVLAGRNIKVAAKESHRPRGSDSESDLSWTEPGKAGARASMEAKSIERLRSALQPRLEREDFIGLVG